jgi:hypothetical protein
MARIIARTKEYIRRGYATITAVHDNTIEVDKLPEGVQVGDFIMLPIPDQEMRVGSLVEIGTLQERKHPIGTPDSTR